MTPVVRRPDRCCLTGERRGGGAKPVRFYLKWLPAQPTGPRANARIAGAALGGADFEFFPFSRRARRG